ncbi:unnamed protein product, partial [Mesorhabditis spiculigera]
MFAIRRSLTIASTSNLLPAINRLKKPTQVSLLTINPARSLSDSKRDRLVHFVCGDQTYTGKAKVGDSLLDVMVDNDLPLDGFGACEGTVACCTCHVILSDEHFKRQDQTNPVSEEELDMLDLSPDLTDNSRLGCQVRVEKEDGPEITVTVPTNRRDARQL